MTDVTRILHEIEQGDPEAAEKLLPLVYDELRALAAVRLAHEKPGQTLQATALVHEAYVRLVSGQQGEWNGRGHFFGAAAEAMRRILVERARRRLSVKRGGGLNRRELDVEFTGESPEDLEQILSIDEALEKLDRVDHESAELVKLRYFAGLSLREAAAVIAVPPRTADRIWAFARSWLAHELGDKSSPPENSDP